MLLNGIIRTSNKLFIIKRLVSGGYIVEVVKVISMFILGIGGILKGIIDIRENTDRPLQVFLYLLIVSIGIIGYALFSKLLFLIIGVMGFVLMFILG